jgi:hypothetical protein
VVGTFDGSRCQGSLSQPRMASSLPGSTAIANREPDTMKPGSLPTRLRSRPVCQLCDYILQQPGNRRAFVSASSLKTPSIRRQPARSHAAISRTIFRSVTTTARQLQELEDVDAGNLQLSDRIAGLKEELAQVEAQIKAIYGYWTSWRMWHGKP